MERESVSIGSEELDEHEGISSSLTVVSDVLTDVVVL